MFKSIYTTRMSGNGKILTKRFERINAKPVRFKRVISSACILIMIITLFLSTVVMAGFNNEAYSLEIINNGEIIKLRNKPFIENGEVYVPLVELFTVLGFMETEEAEITENNGEILIKLYEKSLNEDATAEYTVFCYKIELGKRELIINPEVLMPKITPDEITSVVEKMQNAPLLKNNVIYIPYSYAKRIVERADRGFLSPPDRYKLEFTYSGERIAIVHPLNTYAPILNRFGTRVHPITSENKFHNGIDFKAKTGTGIYAGIDGIISEKAFDSEKGNYVTIKSKNGVEVTYCHLSAFSSIYENKEVTSLTVVGYVGNTGKSTGEHLHMELKINGEYADPELYIVENKYWKFSNEIEAKIPEILEMGGYHDVNYQVEDIDFAENMAFVKLKISKYNDSNVYEDSIVTIICIYDDVSGWLGMVAPESYNEFNFNNDTDINV